MDLWDVPIWSDWFYLIKMLLPRLFVVLMVAFISIRFQWVRRSIQLVDSNWRYRFTLICVFGLFAVSGTLGGVPIDPHHLDVTGCLSTTTLTTLNKNQAIVGFRDTFALLAGLVGGWWVGLGTGLLAGGGRIFFGGFAGIPSSVATVLLGAFAGVVRYYFPQWIKNTWGVFGVALIGTLFQRLVLVLMVTPHDEAVLLAWKIGVPVGVVNIAGCVLFFWLMSDLDRERLENAAEEARLLALQAQVERDRQGQLAQQSELRALRAQVDPHFLNNTLNDLTALIRLDANKARRYVAGLADFFNYTREFAGHNSISLQQELEQLQRYLTLQRLSLGDKLQESVEVPPNLLSLQVLPGCLLTLAENALKHAFKGMSAPYKLHIVAREVAENLMLSVQDNGNGIVPERLALLGKNPVHSSNKSGGVALYNLAQSLMLEFGETAKLDIQCNHANGTVVSLTQPKRSTI